MSNVVWILVITITGWYGSPHTIKIQFDNESVCEQARSSIVGSPDKAECVPHKRTISKTNQTLLK
jgi:hypothetical protein